MDLLILDISLILFVIGNLLGLEYSYRKYPYPYNIKRVDPLALALGILGGIVVNFNLPLGSLLLAFPLGMRSGYGRVEFLIGLALALTLWVLL
ncbi:energy-converting hydrogenase subunit EhaL family protein [Methanocaldococcus infernus]